MVGLMDRVFARFGQDALLRRAGEEVHLKVFFHSVNSSSWQNMERMFLPLGELPRGQYICVFPAGVTVCSEDTLEVGGQTYLVRKTEPMWLRTEPIYQWGLCVEKGSEDAWGMNGSNE